MKRPLLPSQQRTLKTLGENIKFARLRRDLSSEQVAERAGISRNTLIKVEKGDEISLQAPNNKNGRRHMPASLIKTNSLKAFI